MTEEAVTIRDRVNHRQQLPEEVASYVRELIISGTVRPGDFLRMERIADEVGVSNTPVREGLMSLRSEGFVELVPRRGFMVARFTRTDVRDLFWVQAQLAGELAARAARQVTPEQIASLEAVLSQYEQAVASGDQERISEYGHSFHRQINLASGSHRLALMLSSVVRQLPNRFYATIEALVSTTRDDHELLLEAMRNRDARKAKSLMDHHILARGDHLIQLLEERGLWDDPGQKQAS